MDNIDLLRQLNQNAGVNINSPSNTLTPANQPAKTANSNGLDNWFNNDLSAINNNPMLGRFKRVANDITNPKPVHNIWDFGANALNLIGDPFNALTGIASIPLREATHSRPLGYWADMALGFTTPEGVEAGLTKVGILEKGLPDLAKGLKATIPAAEDMKNLTKGTLRQYGATMDVMSNWLDKSLESVHNYFAGKPDAFNHQFIALHQLGTKPEDYSKILGVDAEEGKYLAGVSKTFKDYLDRAFEDDNEFAKANGDSIINYTKNYFPGYWKDLSEKVLKKAGAGGVNTSFKNSKEFKTILDGIKNGYDPMFANPVDFIRKRMITSMQWRSGFNLLKELKENNLLTEGSELTKTDIYGNVIKTHNIPEGSEQLAINGKQYVVPKAIANIYKNWFSPDIYQEGGKLAKGFQTAMRVKSTWVGAKLGLNVFHFISTSQASIAMDIVNGRGLKSLNLVDKYLIGKKIQDAIYSSDFLKEFDLLSHPLNEISPINAAGKPDMLHMITLGGMTTETPDAWIFGIKNMKEQLINDVKSKHWGNVPKDAIGGVVETLNRPITEKWVPRIKLAAFGDIVQDFMHKHPDIDFNPTTIEGKKQLINTLRVNLAPIADQIDNMFGQINYKNLFMNKKLTNLMQALSFSYGWGVGTWRNAIGGIKDLGLGVKEGIETGSLRAGLRKGLTYRSKFALAYPLQIALLGTIATYLITGKPPTDILDVFDPPTGAKDENGNPLRYEIPTQVNEYVKLGDKIYKKGALGGTASYLGSKLGAPEALIKNLIQNRDYWNKEIYNPYAPAINQIGEAAGYTAGQFLPITVNQAKKDFETGINPQNAGKALLNMGVPLAPTSITTPRLESIIQDTYQKYNGELKPYGGMGFPSFSPAKILAENGKPAEAQRELQKIVDNYLSTKPDAYHREAFTKYVKDFIKYQEEPEGFYKFSKLPTEAQVSIFKQMNKTEQAQYWERLPIKTKKDIHEYIDENR